MNIIKLDINPDFQKADAACFIDIRKNNQSLIKTFNALHKHFNFRRLNDFQRHERIIDEA
jgi:hypothetical protein